MNKNLVKSNLTSNTKAILFYCIVSFFLFFEMAIQVSPSVMSTQLMHDLNIGTYGLGLMSGIYFYTYTAMQIPSGLLFDRYNPRIIITFSILICAIGTLLFAIAHNIYTGSFARLLMGTGSAFAFISVLVVTADLFKSKYFASITGITQMLAALGAMSGQMPISSLLSVIGWRNTLFIFSIIGFLLAFIVWKLLKYNKNNSLVSHLPNTNIKTDLKIILSQSQTWYIALYACLLWVPMSSFASLWGVPFLINVNHINPTLAAFLCSLMWLGLAIASPLLGAISTVFNKQVSLLTLSAFVGIISFGLILELNLSPTLIGGLLFLAGAACAGQALSFTVIKENNSHSARSAAIAFNNMAVVISGALFQPLIGKLIALGQVNGTKNYDSHNFRNALLIILFSYVLAFFLAMFLIKKSNPAENP